MSSNFAFINSFRMSSLLILSEHIQIIVASSIVDVFNVFSLNNFSYCSFVPQVKYFFSLQSL